MYRSIIFALVLAFGVGAWIASGYIGTDEPVSADVKKPGAVLSPELKAPTVRTRNVEMGTFADKLKLFGKRIFKSEKTLWATVIIG